MQAELIIIGDEILIGQIIDTNSNWMSSHLDEIGIQVRQISTVGDQETDILSALTLASSRADLVLITGGLGPTKDDVTKKSLATYFNSELILNHDVLKHVEEIFSKYNRAMPVENRKQAEVLKISEVLFNKAGTAPGMWISTGGKYYVVMPGVPSEMKYLMINEVLPRLRVLQGRALRIKRNILTAGLGESFLAEKIKFIEDRLPEYIQLAYLPSYAQVRLRLSGVGGDESKLNKELDSFSDEIKNCLTEYYINDTDETLETTLLKLMSEQNVTLSTAESCTGGLCSHLITSVPGSSRVFLGGVLSYSNEVKMSLLDVSRETLNKHGAVSDETALEMVAGIKKRLGSDYSIAITGIAGPDGGTPDKPVGTVWIAISGLTKTISHKFMFGKLRDENVNKAAKNALVMLHKLVKEESLINKI